MVKIQTLKPNIKINLSLIKFNVSYKEGKETTDTDN